MKLTMDFSVKKTDVTVKKQQIVTASAKVEAVKLPNKVEVEKVVKSLQTSAASLMSKADKISTEVHGNWTRRRQGFADNARNKKETLVKMSVILSKLAEMWLDETIPDILKLIKKASDLETAYYNNFPRPLEPEDEGNWYAEEYHNMLKRALSVGMTSKEVGEQMKELLKNLGKVILSPEQLKAQELEKEIQKLKTYKIDGFFPTPDELIDIMLDYACVIDGMRILEPSAGIGNIIERILHHYPACEITACEINCTLSHILMLKGFNVVANDLFSVVKVQEFDRIIMNPPFESGRDVDHVLYCYNKFLRYNGVLVSIMSVSVLSNTNQKYRAFREFVNVKGGEFIELGQKFKKAFNSTGVSTVLLILRKD
jgi:hypothetical protein